MITVQEADKRIGEQTRILPAESVRIEDAAGRVLREAIRADRDMPPFDRVTRDGIAIARSAWEHGRRTFRIEDTQTAGRPPSRLRDPDGGCVQIMTGAVLPKKCDCVIQYEDLTIEADEVTVRGDLEVMERQYVHRQGSDRATGEVILEPGCVLNGPRIGIVASTGMSTVSVSPFPRVGVLSNGDELVDVGEPVEPFQVRLANNYAVGAALRRRGLPRVTVVHTVDDPARIEQALSELLATQDVLVLSGGVSAGKTDFIPAALERLKVSRVFHRVSQRPGKPLWFGTSGSYQPVFGLPGNPVSTLTCLQRFVFPHLERMMGALDAPVQTARLTAEIRFAPPLTYFCPVTQVEPASGQSSVSPVEYHGSGDHTALAGSSGFVELDRDGSTFPAGTVVPYYRWM
jgi:molybdopterin molybdotransferase